MRDTAQALSKSLGQDVTQWTVAKLLKTVAELGRPVEDDIVKLAVCYATKQVERRLVGLPGWHYLSLECVLDMYKTYAAQDQDNQDKV